jgi:hypothetical protein
MTLIHLCIYLYHFLGIIFIRYSFLTCYTYPFSVPPEHLILDSAPNLGPLISRWEINKFENRCYKSIRILEVLKLLFQQFLRLSSQRDMNGPI